MGKSKTHITFRMVEAWEAKRTDKGGKCAQNIRLEIERISNEKLRLEPTHPSVEGGYVQGYKDKGKELDYKVYCGNDLIAILDPTCSHYTFENSQIMPVNAYKGKVIKQSKVPAFIVFSMELEPRTLKDRCVWIRGKDVIKLNHWREELGGKIQDNHYTDKNDWHRGLQTLVDELLKIAELH